MHAIRGQQHVAADIIAIGQMQRHTAPGVFITGTRDAGLDGLRRYGAHRLHQHGMEVAAMREPVRCAVTLH